MLIVGLVLLAALGGALFAFSVLQRQRPTPRHCRRPTPPLCDVHPDRAPAFDLPVRPRPTPAGLVQAVGGWKPLTPPPVPLIPVGSPTARTYSADRGPTPEPPAPKPKKKTSAPRKRAAAAKKTTTRPRVRATTVRTA